MSVLLQARHLQHQAGPQQVFDDLSLVVNAGDRIGLVGHNGSGKSTLLKLLSLEQAPDAGEIAVQRGLRIAQVAQFLPASMQEMPLRDALLASTAEAEAWRAETLLTDFAFTKEQWQQPVGSLSGGQQNRLMFAQALAADPQLLLLDEPTNHLDLATTVLFEGRLRSFAGACVLVSHDRAFLDAVTSTTVFLRDRRLQRFACSYSPARLDLQAADEAAARRAGAEQKAIDALKVSAKRLATWGKVYDNEDLARRAKSMNKRVTKLEEERTEVSAGSPLSLSLSLAGSKARQTLAIDALRVQVPGRTLFQIEDLVLRPGERVALLGHNGCGKSTFIKKIVAAVGSEDAQIRISPQARLGYYDQELDEVPGSMTMVEFARQRTSLAEQPLRQRLISAGFAYADHDKRIETMSGGERARLLFLTLSAMAPNFLILDEPTNHIDIEGKEQLEAQLLSSAATVVITSHDRRFIETVASRYLLIEQGRLRQVNDPEAFFASRPEQMQAEGELESAANNPSPDLSSTEDELIAEIEELEALLRADQARKPKFRKPQRQAQWQVRLEELYGRLDSE